MNPNVPITVNGKTIEAEAGANLLRTLLDHGIFVPHYCYHPALSVAGNCRMCLVKIAGSRKLETSCTLRVASGLVVETEAPEVVKARKDILEFLLINHPLDCPVCDQAGECLLQDFSYVYGSDSSRFTEDKTIRQSKPFGPLVHYWGNRCIVCTRCVRFCNEITKTGELAVVGRSDHSEIDVFPDRPLDNPLSGNVIDLCPVGALLNRDFLYQSRVWFLQTAETICGGCSRGCNILADSLEGAIKRLRPRTNHEVNDWWICDAGRLSFQATQGASRLRAPRILGAEEKPSTTSLRAASTALDRLGAAIKQWGPGGVAGIASGFATNEELFLFGRLLDRFGIRVAACLTRREGEDRRLACGFVIDAEKAPNRRGAERILGPGTVAEGLARLEGEIRAGSVRALVVLGGDPRGTPGSLEALLDRVTLPLVIDAWDGPLAQRAEVVLPGAAWTEKNGTMVNSRDRDRKSVV